MKTIRIGSGAGYAGDRLEPSLELIEKGNLDYISYECLAERTIAIGQQAKLKDPAKGYNGLLEHRMEKALPLAWEHKVKIITNMGSANPQAAAKKCVEIARKHGLIDPDKFNFLWVVDFPLFEYSEQEGRWMAMHHPFTLPKAEDLDKVESDPGACHAVAYDIVLNGVEMGGGSMRINDPALQDRMFHALGFTEEKARESFGFLMDAYKFGAPPHGGMAYGLDRMVMLMLKKDSIRDVIAFPKVQNAGEPMSGAPDVVDEQQLKDLSIALTLKD